MPKPGYYAVRVGKNPGIYNNWTDCEMQVKGFPKAEFKKFPTMEQAKDFMNKSITHQSIQIDRFISNNQQLIISKPATHQLIPTDCFMSKPAPEREMSLSNDLDSDFLNLLSNSDIFNSCDFDEDIMPLVTPETDVLVPVPKLIYNSTSSRDSYYAVHRGIKPGIYRTWTECSQQIKDFPNASYRKFDTEEDALEYVRTGGIKKASKRELQNLNISNKVIKRQKLNATETSGYLLRNPEEPVVVFTDGASTENGKRRSKAGIGVYWGYNHPLNASKRISGRQTNNRAEIYAAVHALNQAKQIGARKVKLYTDSQFVIHAITDWIKKWKQNGWKLVTGKDVVNKEDLIALDAAQKDLEVEWIYVRAHANNKGNDEADRLAVAGSKLLLEPGNCSEFEKFQTEMNDQDESSNEPFILTNSSSTEILPLILPNDEVKKPFYAVHKGKQPGIYSTWTECEKQIKNFPQPKFRKFFSEEEAKEFVKSGKVVKAELSAPKYKDGEYVTVFTDGASSGNGQEGAQAGIGVYWGPGNQLNTSMRLPGRQTNNRAEIFAAVHALRQAKKLGIKNVRLYTDSQFVINGITSWIKKWKENDWKLGTGKPVINKDDFIALDDACQGLNIDWCYVKGHANIPGNVEADKLAVAGCSKSLMDTIILT